jgi:hypothetical protein
LAVGFTERKGVVAALRALWDRIVPPAGAFYEMPFDYFHGVDVR